MAANIEIRNGVASFAENGLKGRAWHRLGDDQQIFDRPMFVDEALKACHADYTVQTQPVVVLTDEIQKAMANGDMISADMLLDLVIPNKMATVRTDLTKSLGVVSESYGIVQNSCAFKFVDMFCSGQFAERDNIPVIETCGVLGRGERVFVTAKFPQKVVIDSRRDDILDMYVVFTTSHDGSGCVKCMVTPVRVVCNNTLNIAMRNNIGRIAFRHSSKVMDRIDLLNKENAEWAYKTLNVYEAYTNSLKQDLEHLRNIRLSEKDLDNILADVLLSPEAAKAFHEEGTIYADGIKTRGRNIFLNVKNAMETGIGQYGQETGTGLWALNGLTTYFQNEAKYSNEEIKFDSLLSGNAYNKVQQFHEALLAIA